ncbi:YhcH/YjgK/YiaL family protein [Clostridium septicum]|uniref:DUF386 domain-containing protein n=1 Tax=Clostridium septicum TaxID=1504 RepID=A0A9N7JMN9_CLOSE|nr:YhcH/YjgK/YiaL family protein [Clostridium septicum]AYE34939.1 DUF386 domain-containing protein [Clostridium septicum]MDU1313842.1 YhcH/YjgK/YiaL family protein [Clostridium septicum]QAS60333.1 DUF386 domain-containing protein [Clostridium septicum]UEC20412.1 YhcH/YjgK/YiaL family protein [Clostridium septicum]USS01531.1 YhcH/YjgK/YiaL family protein [Clostridium septicum]
MIYGSLKHMDRYNFLDRDIIDCFKYTIEKNLSNFEKGTYKIDGDNMFVNVVEYETQNKEDRFWEAHKKYIDIHLMIEGKEKIQVNSIENLEAKEYEEKNDFVSLEGLESGYVTLRKGDFLICYPEDAHMTAIKVDNTEKVKKAIFKVIIK